MRVFLQKRRAALPPRRRRATPSLWHGRAATERRRIACDFRAGWWRPCARCDSSAEFIRRFHPC